MRTIRLLFVFAAFAGWSSSLHADEQKVPLDKLPGAVANAVKKRFPQAELKAASKETENGKTEYEVAIVDGGTKMDVLLTPDGVITEIEKEIALTDLPKAVRATLEKDYANAKYKKVEEVIKVAAGKEALDFYEIVIEKADNKKVEVQIAADGKVKKEE
jgi:hypothetical protein